MTPDPGWLYMLRKPCLDRIEQKDYYGYKYIYRNDSLNIKLTADDFALETDVRLKMTTTLDSVIIYPNFSYIESPHFSDKAHVPCWIAFSYFSQDSLIFRKWYNISETKRGKPYGVVSLEAWQENSITIDDRIRRKKISKDEFLSPYCLHNGDILLVAFSYAGFAIYDKRNRNYPFTSEKSDFIFHYDIYGNENPLIFHFLPERPPRAPDTAWTKKFGGSGSDECMAVLQADDGGYILTGYESDITDKDKNVCLIKTDSLGNTIWTRTFGDDSDEIGYSVQQTKDRGYIISGVTSSYGTGGRDVYLIKTDSEGHAIWVKTFGGDNFELGYEVRQTTDGGYIIAGETNSYGAGNYDVYLIKTDSTGDTLWTKTFGGSADEWGHSVQQASDGGYIVTGNTSSYGAGMQDIYLIKTNSLGDTLWTRAFGGSKDDYGESVLQTTDGGYIVVGTTTSYDTVASDIAVLRTDSLGDILWSRRFGEEHHNERGSSVQEVEGGDYIIVGSSGACGVEISDVYIVRIDNSGNEFWSKAVGGSRGTLFGTSIRQVKDRGYIIGASELPRYDPGEGNIYLIKLKSEF
jgi:hypothetical protein